MSTWFTHRKSNPSTHPADPPTHPEAHIDPQGSWAQRCQAKILCGPWRSGLQKILCDLFSGRNSKDIWEMWTSPWDFLEEKLQHDMRTLLPENIWAKQWTSEAVASGSRRQARLYAARIRRCQTIWFGIFQNTLTAKSAHRYKRTFIDLAQNGFKKGKLFRTSVAVGMVLFWPDKRDTTFPLNGFSNKSWTQSGKSLLISWATP